jgi:hypothetical protein
MQVVLCQPGNDVTVAANDGKVFMNIVYDGEWPPCSGDWMRLNQSRRKIKHHGLA